MRKLYLALNGFMAAIFIFGAALQYNDPAPIRWMAIYVAAALPCVLVLMNKETWKIPLVVAVVSLIWASIYATRGAWSVPFLDMFDEWEMKNQQVLETREMFGLCIIATWMILLAAVAWRKTSNQRL